MTVVIDGTLTNPNYPRFGYSNLSRTATVTASSEATDFDATNVQNGLTWNFWKPTTQNSYLDFAFGSSTTINYVGIAAHNMGTQGNTVLIQRANGTSPETYTTIDSHTPTDDSVIMFLFDDVSNTDFRISITGGSVPSIGVVYMGDVMVSERPFYGGHTPITLSKKTVVRPQKSEGGQWLGRTKIREGAQTSITINNLSAAWVRSTFSDFIDSAIDYPFFFAWRPTSYPAEVAYCWTAGDITASNTGQADKMQTSFNVDALL